MLKTSADGSQNNARALLQLFHYHSTQLILSFNHCSLYSSCYSLISIHHHHLHFPLRHSLLRYYCLLDLNSLL